MKNNRVRFCTHLGRKKDTSLPAHGRLLHSRSASRYTVHTKGTCEMYVQPLEANLISELNHYYHYYNHYYNYYYNYYYNHYYNRYCYYYYY